jgi:hypothetical protein
MQPLPNASELAEIALKNYYETESNTLTKSTCTDAGDQPFYKDISPKRQNRFVAFEEQEKEKYANEVFENYRSTSRSVSSSSRKVREAQTKLN